MPDAADRFFLSSSERGNPDSDIDSLAVPDGAWTEGNSVTALVDGVAYFARLATELGRLESGDALWFTEWRADRDELLSAQGPAVGELLAALAGRGVDVRGLVWRSHPLGELANRGLEAEINRSGGQVLLDQRVLPFGSHHQKLVLVRPRSRPGVAFVGGIDLCHGRRDGPDHGGDPQPMDRHSRYGPRAPWHDLQLELRGPALAQLELSFRERWEDPSRLDDSPNLRAVLSRLRSRLTRKSSSPAPLPPASAAPDPVSQQAVQVLRTYPRRRPPYPFARQGELSSARALTKAIGQAERLIYIEDQYLWSREVVDPLARRLQARPALHLILLLPRWPNSRGRLTGPPNRIGQLAALARLKEAGGPRVLVFDLENPAGRAVYVHAKVCIIDDIWAMVGSANFNLRSFTHDSELSCSVIDRLRDPRPPLDPAGQGVGARVFARSLRLQLWSEHLGLSASDPRLLDPAEAPSLWRQAAMEVAEWHLGRARQPHPRGRVLAHRPEPLPPWSRWWAQPIYSRVYDPDARPQELIRQSRF